MGKEGTLGGGGDDLGYVMDIYYSENEVISTSWFVVSFTVTDFDFRWDV